MTVSSKAITTRINMKSAHKLAKFAMIVQANDNSGNLTYNDFLKYYLLNPIVPVVTPIAVKSPLLSKEVVYDALSLICVYIITTFVLCLPLATATGGLFTFDNILTSLIATGLLMGLPKLVVDYQHGTGLFTNKGAA